MRDIKKEDALQVVVACGDRGREREKGGGIVLLLLLRRCRNVPRARSGDDRGLLEEEIINLGRALTIKSAARVTSMKLMRTSGKLRSRN
jgi:hypothetical protein